MNLNEQLRQAYEDGRRQGLNEQGRSPGPGGPGELRAPVPPPRGDMTQRRDPPAPPRGGATIIDEVIQWYGQTVPPAPQYLDFNGDGIIGVDDLLYILGHIAPGAPG